MGSLVVSDDWAIGTGTAAANSRSGMIVEAEGNPTGNRESPAFRRSDYRKVRS